MTAPEQMRAALRAELERQCNIGAGEFSVCPETGLWQVSADLDIDSLLRALTRPAPAELVEAQWQPIETFSERDFSDAFGASRWFLVATSDGRVTEGSPFILDGGKRAWICARGYNCSDPRWPSEYLTNSVTHIRPLPAPPTALRNAGAAS